MGRTARRPSPAPAAAGDEHPADQPLLGIGDAARQAGVSQRALRYYQQIGLITPCSSTPGGMRRYSAADLQRVARIRQLQELLGLNLDEIAQVLGAEDRLAEIKLAYYDEDTSCAERQALIRESLELHQALRATVEAKRRGIEGFLTDLDARIGRMQAQLAEITAAAATAGAGPAN